MNQREIKGKQIIEKPDQIKKISDGYYLVNSQSKNSKQYDVISTERGWECSCYDYKFRRNSCKHIHSIILSQSIKKQVKKNIIIKEVNTNCCKFCNSENIILKGKNKGKQQYKCKDCMRRFVINLGFERLKATPERVTASMNLYFNGESLRHTADSMKLFGVDVTHKTIENWIKKYVSLMEKYLESITPDLSEKWRTDEIYLKIKGDRKYLYALMDDETRYWIAKQVSDNKYTQDVKPMFRKAEKIAKKKPSLLISDGAANFHEAWKDEWKAKNFLHKDTEHIRHIHMKNDYNNNKMERLNGTIRDREKVMRSLKTDDSAIISGMQIHHNYLRPHSGINGKTPAEASGVKIEGDNKWITLIQNAKKSQVTPLHRRKRVTQITQNPENDKNLYSM